MENRGGGVKIFTPVRCKRKYIPGNILKKLEGYFNIAKHQFAFFANSSLFTRFARGHPYESRAKGIKDIKIRLQRSVNLGRNNESF